MHICGIQKDGTDKPICRAAMAAKTLRTDKCLLKGTHNKYFRIFSLRGKIKDTMQVLLQPFKNVKGVIVYEPYKNRWQAN